jgi:hypothetical protein
VNAVIGNADQIVFQNMDGQPGMEILGYSAIDAVNYYNSDGLLVPGYAGNGWRQIYWNGTSPFNLAPSEQVAEVGSTLFDLVDIYSDGLGDVIVGNFDGTIECFINQNNTLPFDSFFIETGVTDSYSIRSEDMDGDGDEDILMMKQGAIYILANDVDIVNEAILEVNIFIDENTNGVQDNSELPYYGAQLALSMDGASTSNYYIYDGQLSLADFTGISNISVSAVDNSAFYSPQGTFPILVDVNDPNSENIINIPYIADAAPVNSIWAFASAYPGICTGPAVVHYVGIQNEGSTYASGTITYNLSLFHNYISSSVAPAAINGNTIQWTYQNVPPGQFYYIPVLVTAVDLSNMGQLSENSVTATVEDNMNNIVFTASSTSNHAIQCSYDPNDITEHNGHTESGYILSGDDLEYTIRFQNTGNAPAEDVRIENQLPVNVNRSTMQPIAWSHDFELVIDENGKAIFYFDNINLADSTNDEPNSHGFVRYRITSNSDLMAGDIIENSAEIFFDFNPAVVTNTELNTIYECADLEQATASATEVCTGDEITFSNNATWIENLTWSFNGQPVGEGNYTHTLTESGTMEMQVSNSLCEYMQSWNLVANTASASFAHSGNTLTASPAATYQWYLNGNEIAGATAQNYEIIETGIYAVVITDENGCSDLSEPMQVTFIGIGEMNADEITLYPNPASDFLVITVGNSVIRSADILDMIGRVVLSINLMGVSTSTIDIGHLEAGEYILRINTHEVRKFSIIK